MILTFQNWVITKPPGSLGYQYDNDSQVLTLGGTLPEGYTWDALVQSGQNFDVWNLGPSENGPTITLSEDNLANTGEYYVQIRGTNGEVVQHTNIVSLYVPRSLVGPGTWPTLPTEFAQAEQNIKELNAHPPIPGENGYWLLWDLANSAYRESQLPVPVGPAGPANTLTIGTVETLPADQPATASITGESPAQKLNLGIPQGKQGATGNPGAPGKDGQTPTITAGEVEKLEPDQDPTASITGETPNLVLNLGIPQGQPGQDGVQINDGAVNTTETWSSKKLLDTLCPAFIETGNPVTCNPVEDYPLNATVTMEPIQEGTGDPSPENVRPISGYDSVTVNLRGKNLFNISKIESFEHVTNNEDGSLTVVTPADSNGVSSGKTLRELCGNIAPGLYTLNAESTGSEKWVYTPATGVWHYGTSKTLTDEMLDSTLYLYASGLETTATISNIQVEFGSTTTPYEPYQPGTTSQLSFPETIYGGTVDAVTGEGSKTWGFIASYNGESLPGEWISDRDVYASGTTPTTGAQVAYKLATPEPFQATGNQALPAVAGLNTVYTDGDSLAVSGRQDLLYTLQTMQAQTQNLNRFIAEGGTQ